MGQRGVPSRIAEAGIDLLRYPGGSYSDIYHWSNHTASGGYSANQSDFGRFVQIMDQAGTQGMVTVDYGSSHQFTKGVNLRKPLLGSPTRTEMPACTARRTTSRSALTMKATIGERSATGPTCER